jgi:hypothetical protein
MMSLSYTLFEHSEKSQPTHWGYISMLRIRNPQWAGEGSALQSRSTESLKETMSLSLRLQTLFKPALKSWANGAVGKKNWIFNGEFMSDEKKTKWIKVRVSELERAEIESKAVAAGRSIADLIRLSLTKAKTPSIANLTLERQKIREISRIGQNLNQIARFCNMHKSNADTVQILSALVSIEKKLNSFSLPPHSRDSVNKKNKED